MAGEVQISFEVASGSVGVAAVEEWMQGEKDGVPVEGMLEA